MSRDVLVDVRGHIMVATINRPERLNALHPDACSELDKLWDYFRDDPNLWVAVLTGAGERAFCAGFDLKWAATHGSASLQELWGVNGFGGLTSRSDLFKPVIAAVRGYCVGGGFELALACDLVIAGFGATFGFPEPLRGNVAMSGGVQRLSWALPPALARRWLFFGDMMSAREALEYGLVTEVVDDELVLQRALELAERLCKVASPLAIQATKALALEVLRRPLLDCIRDVRHHPLIARLQSSEDHTEGIRAFAEGRQPEWKGW